MSQEPVHPIFDSLAALFYAHDPMGLAALGVPGDEYEPEARTVLPRLETCKSEEELVGILHEEFVSWFQESAGPREKYVELASKVWALWNAQKK